MFGFFIYCENIPYQPFHYIISQALTANYFQSMQQNFINNMGHIERNTSWLSHVQNTDVVAVVLFPKAAKFLSSYHQRFLRCTDEFTPRNVISINICMISVATSNCQSLEDSIKHHTSWIFITLDSMHDSSSLVRKAMYSPSRKFCSFTSSP